MRYLTSWSIAEVEFQALAALGIGKANGPQTKVERRQGFRLCHLYPEAGRIAGQEQWQWHGQGADGRDEQGR